MTAQDGRAPRVSRVILSDFRSYPALDLALAGRLVALTGENGAGKTNLIEALSLFTAGRGLRRADLAEMQRASGAGGFAVSVAVEGAEDAVRLGTGIERLPDGSLSPRRSRVDGVAVSSPAAFADHLRVVWLTPALDALFTGAAGDRRRFLDRLVLALDARHGSRVSAYERALRSRNRLLEEPRPDRAWLDGIEGEAATLAAAVATARMRMAGPLADLAAGTRDDAAAFPWADLAIEGEIEAIASSDEAAAAERMKQLLRDGRPRDAAAGRALAGPHTSDVKVRHGPKDVAAERASTGEQKALLVGIVLAHARLVASVSGLAPLVLLDEVAAHLDRRRRAALYAALDALGSQVFMTGADPALFGELPAGAEIFSVASGNVTPLR
ncbi:MAG: DNA replication/repair protein RecF [Bosea sp.]|nr:DNA replication/repair protein RecF [Bosea sp. (in: a-proteobacteria)]